MTDISTAPSKPFARILLALVLVAFGLYVTIAEDAPGAAISGGFLMMLGVVIGVRAARLPARAARASLAGGVAVAAIAAFVIHGVVVTAALFPQSQTIPSAMDAAPSPQYAAAVERARDVVRAAVLEQNLPGVSIAVGAGGRLVWAEGFGWRDIATQTPVTPHTRFNIGTAYSVVAPRVAALGLTNTGSDTAADWSPGHIGTPDDDFPPFTMIRHLIFRPLGLAPDEPIAGDRATFYVPRSDDDPRTGRRLMYMRDLSCCANDAAFYSTPPDLVRFSLATNAGSVNGELAGGTVMSLTTRGSGVVVAVTSNIAHANTSSLAERIGDAIGQ